MYQFTIRTKAYRPHNGRKWSELNGTMAALDARSYVEEDLDRLRWRISLFLGYGIDDDSQQYQAWMEANQKAAILFFDMASQSLRSILPQAPGFKQGYVNVDKLIEEVESTGSVTLPFSAAYDVRQYDKHMDGCFVEIRKVELDNVRSDFVTNSSSTSFLVAYKELPSAPDGPFADSLNQLFSDTLRSCWWNLDEDFFTIENEDELIDFFYRELDEDRPRGPIDRNRFLMENPSIKDEYEKCVELLEQGYVIVHRVVKYDNKAHIKTMRSLIREGQIIEIREKER